MTCIDGVLSRLRCHTNACIIEFESLLKVNQTTLTFAAHAGRLYKTLKVLAVSFMNQWCVWLSRRTTPVRSYACQTSRWSCLTARCWWAREENGKNGDWRRSERLPLPKHFVTKKHHRVDIVSACPVPCSWTQFFLNREHWTEAWKRDFPLGRFECL